MNRVIGFSWHIWLLPCLSLLYLCIYQCNPQLPQIWAEVGICTTENYNSPPTVGSLAIQTPTKSRLANPRNTGSRRGSVRSCGVGLVMSWCEWILV